MKDAIELYLQKKLNIKCREFQLILQMIVIKINFTITMYSIKYTIKNENSVLPILIEKNFEQKIYFSLLKMRSIFFKEGNERERRDVYTLKCTHALLIRITYARL